MKKYWLSLHPDTFLWVKNETLCIYNAEDGSFLKFPFSKELERVTNGLQEINNLYTITITEKDLESLVVYDWINKLIETGCCDWVADDGINQKPISLKPMLKITDNVDYYKDGHSKGRNANLLSNLHRLVVYLNESEYGNDAYTYQCIYPFKKQKELDFKELCDFIISSGIPVYLSEIAFVGCLWRYEEYESLLNFLNRLSINVTLYCTEQDYYNYTIEEDAPSLPQKYTLHILKERYQKEDYDFGLLSTQGKLIWHFILTSEEDYLTANHLLEKYDIENYRLIPVYTGDNRKFFEDFVFTSEDEILDYRPSKREVFANQTLNTNFFGTLHILPRGEVSGGNKVIGKLTDSLYEIVYREMTEGDSWFHIRNQKPCCNCCYQWLCPSPSRYESVLNKPNLCNVVE